MYHKEKQNNCRDTKVQSIVKRRQKTTTKTHLTTTKRPKNHHTETRNDYKAAGNSSKETPWPSGCKWGAGRPFTRLCPGPCCLTIPSTAVGGDEMRRSRASVAGWGDGGGDSLIKACLSLDLFTPPKLRSARPVGAARPLAFHLADEGEHWCRGFPCGFSFHGAGVKYERGVAELTMATRGSSRWELRTQKMPCSGSSSGPSCLQHKSIERSD